MRQRERAERAAAGPRGQQLQRVLLLLDNSDSSAIVAAPEVACIDKLDQTLRIQHAQLDAVRFHLGEQSGNLGKLCGRAAVQIKTGSSGEKSH